MSICDFFVGGLFTKFCLLRQDKSKRPALKTKEEGKMEKRIGVVGIILNDVNKAEEVNAVLHEYSEIIAGRMGLPKQKQVSCSYFYNCGCNS